MKLRSIWHFNRLTFFLLDYLLLWGAVVLAYKFSPRYFEQIIVGPWLNPELRFIGYGMPLAMALGLQVTDVQRTQSGYRTSGIIAQTVAGLAGGMLLFVIIHAVAQFSLIGRYILIFSLGYGTVLITASRLVIWRLAEQQRRNVLFYGTAETCHLLARQLAAAHLPIAIVGHLRLPDLLDEGVGEGAAGAKSNRTLHAAKLGAEEIIVESPDELNLTERQALLACTGLGVTVMELGYFYERELEQIYVPGLKESWFWGYDPAYGHPVFFATKRLLDVAISLLGILACTPFAPLVLLLIKLQDGGPAIYSQVRVGANNQLFRIYKLRTMRTDAEKAGAQWAARNDSRVTPIGRFLRLTRIDEVPQFWNILRGEMSFIGPRPERPEFVEKIEKEIPLYRYRHLIKPGLTGWAQINYPYGASLEDARNKMAYDLYYLKYGNITREMHIMLRTLVAMIRGAR